MPGKKVLHQVALQKNIGLWSATTVVIGSVIGSSIFMKPATMAGQLGSPVLLIVVWVVAGLISLFGAMAFAELGSMFPQTGGEYIYLEKTYGDFLGFLYGWSSIAVINTAAIASIAFVCADPFYRGYISAAKPGRKTTGHCDHRWTEYRELYQCTLRQCHSVYCYRS